PALTPELLHRLTRVLEVAVEAHPGRLQADLEVTQLPVYLGVDHDLGDLHPSPVAELLEDGRLEALGVGALGGGGEEGAVVVTELGQRLAMAVEPGQGVVERRQAPLADGMDGGVDGDGRAAQLLTRV